MKNTIDEFKQQQLRARITAAFRAAFRAKHPDGPLELPEGELQLFQRLLNIGTDAMLNIRWFADMLTRTVELVDEDERLGVGFRRVQQEFEDSNPWARTICCCGHGIYFSVNGSAWYHMDTHRQPCNWRPDDVDGTTYVKFAAPAHESCEACHENGWNGCYRCMPTKWKRASNEDQMIAAMCADAGAQDLEELDERGYEVDG